MKKGKLFRETKNLMETKFVKNSTFTKFRKIQWKQNLEKRSKCIQKFV